MTDSISRSRTTVEAINNPATSSEDVLRLAEELLSTTSMIYVGSGKESSDIMIQNILLALIKQARK